MNMMHDSHAQTRPLIAITPDLLDRNGHETIRCTSAYARAIWDAGGHGVVVTPSTGSIAEMVSRFDGFVLSGGDDPCTESFGVPTHPKTTRVHPIRQSFETALLVELRDRDADKPVLGVCLGMQMMALVAGGALDQFMPESVSTHDEHWENTHEVSPVTGVDFPEGSVRSKHHQSVNNPGSMRVIAHAPDHVVEAIDDPSRGYYVGVQWHPERTADHVMGQGIFDSFVRACRS